MSASCTSQPYTQSLSVRTIFINVRTQYHNLLRNWSVKNLWWWMSLSPKLCPNGLDFRLDESIVWHTMVWSIWTVLFSDEFQFVTDKFFTKKKRILVVKKNKNKDEILLRGERIHYIKSSTKIWEIGGLQFFNISRCICSFLQLYKLKKHQVETIYKRVLRGLLLVRSQYSQEQFDKLEDSNDSIN